MLALVKHDSSFLLALYWAVYSLISFRVNEGGKRFCPLASLLAWSLTGQYIHTIYLMMSLLCCSLYFIQMGLSKRLTSCAESAPVWLAIGQRHVFACQSSPKMNFIHHCNSTGMNCCKISVLKVTGPYLPNARWEKKIHSCQPVLVNAESEISGITVRHYDISHLVKRRSIQKTEGRNVKFSSCSQSVDMLSTV